MTDNDERVIRVIELKLKLFCIVLKIGRIPSHVSSIVHNNVQLCDATGCIVVTTVGVVSMTAKNCISSPAPRVPVLHNFSFRLRNKIAFGGNFSFTSSQFCFTKIELHVFAYFRRCGARINSESVEM